ncbi:MAG: putative toxin-antitoxin system toxin component, PIN family [Methanosarcinales archaeon]
MKLAIANEIRAYASIETFKEFSEVIRRPYFKLEQNEIDEIESLLLKVLNFVGPRKKVEIIKDDASDNKFIECAGDKHLLTLKEYENIKIVTASEFLEIWQK